MVKKYVIGFLLFVVLASSYYVLLPDKVRVDVQKTRSRYSVYEGAWVLSATEYVNLFDGAKKMRAKNRSLEWSESMGIIEITRIANYKDSISTIETYEFDSTRPDVELVPVTHITRCSNCVGKILQFEYRNILYTGDTMDITSPFNFGHNMKLEWQDGEYRAKVYQQKVASDKIILRYRPQSDYESFYVRLFDPVLSTALEGNLTWHIHPDAKYDNVTLGGVFSPDWSIISTLVNFSVNATMQSGNYSWNFSEVNISSVGAWTFNFTNNDTANFNFTVRIKLNETNASRWQLFYDNNSVLLNLTSTDWVSIINVTGNTTELVNLTLNLYNISQTYANWTLIKSTASWSFNFSLNISKY